MNSQLMQRVMAAREALAPIRELHKPRSKDDFCGTAYEVCDECEFDWPCETAKLIYRKDEL